MGMLNLSVRGKFFASFGSLLGLMLVIGVVSFIGLNRLAENAKFIEVDAYPKAVLANNLAKRGMDVERLALSGILASDAEEIKTTIGRIKELSAVNGQDMDTLSKQVASESGKKMFARILDTRAVIREKYSQLFELMIAGDKDKSSAFMKKEFSPAILAFRESLSALSEHQDNKLKELIFEMQLSSGSTRNTVALVGALAFAAGIGLAIWLSGSFSRRILEVKVLAEKVASGSLKEDGARASSTDELGQLMTALIRMRADLAGIITKVTEGAFTVSQLAEEVSTATQQVSSLTVSIKTMYCRHFFVLFRRSDECEPAI